MKKKPYVFILPALGAFLMLILICAYPCAAGESTRVMIAAGRLADLPMEISFNGRTQQEGLRANAYADGQVSPVTLLPADLFKYFTFSAPVSGREMFDSGDTGIEGNTSEKVSFEIQAGLFEPSGALFIVFQL